MAGGPPSQAGGACGGWHSAHHSKGEAARQALGVREVGAEGAHGPWGKGASAGPPEHAMHYVFSYSAAARAAEAMAGRYARTDEAAAHLGTRGGGAQGVCGMPGGGNHGELNAVDGGPCARALNST